MMPLVCFKSEVGGGKNISWVGTRVPAVAGSGRVKRGKGMERKMIDQPSGAINSPPDLREAQQEENLYT